LLKLACTLQPSHTPPDPHVTDVGCWPATVHLQPSGECWSGCRASLGPSTVWQTLQL
jgi:hypothetical protein